MLKEMRPALTMTAALTVVAGLIYPLAVTGVAQAVFPRQAAGSLIERNGAVIGSALIGQDFTAEKYFRGRPSATSGPDPSDPAKSAPQPYNAANSGGSNIAPTSRTLVERVRSDADKLKAENPAQPVPPELVMTSASGLDPEISPTAALFQAPRVAKARGLPEEQLRSLIEAQTTTRLLGFIGEPVVNVLKLNLALDNLGKN